MKKILFLFLLAISWSNIFAFTISHYAPSTFNASNMTLTNTNLGVSGYFFEDFTDSTLIPGLTITAISSVYNGWFGSTVTTTVHQGSNTSGIFPDALSSWSGTGVIYPQTVANIHRFDFAQGISSFGIGIAEIDDIGGPHAIYINDVDTGLRIESLSSFVRTGYRNIYIRVDAGAGEKINSFSLQTTPATSGNVESLFFSHLAFKEDPNIGTQVPETGTFFLLSLSILFFSQKIKNRLEKK